MVVVAVAMSIAPAIQAADRVTATVTHVADIDLLQVRYPNGDLERIRVIGLDSPVGRHPSQPEGIYKAEAVRYAEALVLNREVDLSPDSVLTAGHIERDDDGRRFAHVTVPPGLPYALHLIAQGYVRPNPNWPFDPAMMESYRSAQLAALNAKRGIWARSVPEPFEPQSFRYSWEGFARNTLTTIYYLGIYSVYGIAVWNRHDPAILESPR